MKIIIIKKSIGESFLTALVLILFAYIAMATIGGISQQKNKLPDGRWEIAKYYSGGNSEIITGNVDNAGRFEGPVKIVYENSEYVVTHTEEVDMKAGVRHGLSKLIYPGGKVYYHCYQHGERVEMENCEQKSASGIENGNSAFEIFSYNFPWFAFKLDACGYDSAYVKAYLDTLETVMYSGIIQEDEFDNLYEEAVSILEETAYDSIIQLNDELSLYIGTDLILSHEFRLATIHSYTVSDSNTCRTVKSVYPNYLLMLNETGISDTDFEGFCSEYDAIMSSYDPISLDDPYLIDSLDERMYRTLDIILSGDEISAKELESLKKALMTNEVKNTRDVQRPDLSQLKSQMLNNSPSEVAEIILFTFLEKFLEGDIMKDAVKEAYTLKKGIVSLPTVVTIFSGNTSSTSVSVKGNVIKDGGGDVTSRGIAWDTVYNPTTENQVVTSGTGTGDFITDLTELTEGETYYARAYATNSAGTAYGNCISFVVTAAIGIEENSISASEFSIYPNPASDHVFISFKAEDPEGMVFTMYDLNGKIVLQEELVNIIQGNNKVNINLSELENGFYMCRIEGENKIFEAQKIMINR